MNYVRIVPPESHPSGATKTEGTRVFVGDVEIHGITRIEMKAELQDVWRAKIECYASVESLSVLAEFGLIPLRPLVRRVKSRRAR